MKKLLALLGIFSITASTTLFLTGCKKSNESKLVEKQDLSEVIKNTDLGGLDSNDKDDILSTLKNKNCNLDINEIEVIGISENDEIIIPKLNSQKYKGQVKVTYNLRQDLNEFIKNTNLGWLDDNSNKTILDVLINKNPSLNIININEIEVIDISETSATIKPIPGSQKYKGQVNVTYNLRQDLNEFIKNTNLGWLDDNSNKTILDVLINKNPSLNIININEIEVIDISETSATIKPIPGSQKYKGQVNVTYNLIQDLSAVIKNTNLGWVDIDMDILDVVKDKNPNLDIDEVEVTNMGKDQQSWAIIEPMLDSQKYKGQVKVTYNLRNYLDYVILNKDLDVVIKDDNHRVILNALKIKNPNLDKDELEVKEIVHQKNGIADATIVPIWNSQKYKGQTIVHYKWKWENEI